MYVSRPSRAPWRWPLWQAPRRALIFIIVVETLAVGVSLAIGIRDDTMSSRSWVNFCAIVGFGLVVAEMTRRVERIRRRFNDTPHVNFTSVWVIPAAVLLPSPLAAAVVVVLYLHLFWRSWYRVRGVHAYRLTFSATSIVLSAYVVSVITRPVAPRDLAGWGETTTIGAIVLSLLAFSVVNSGLVGTAICLFEGRLDVRRAYGTARENALEYGTLGLGAIVALLVVVHPAWPIIMVPALLVLHRSVLMRQLEQAAATDPKTGLTNAVAWTTIAAQEIERARGQDTPVGVLMIDLDSFKRVNDVHGHVVGDQVLQAVADTLSESVRRNDLVGRWGGEEFVVLCPEVTTDELMRIGERICHVVRQLRVPVALPGHETAVDDLTVSIGVATFPVVGSDLQDVLVAADDALFVAKDRGRDQVRSVVIGEDWYGSPS